MCSKYCPQNKNRDGSPKNALLPPKLRLPTSILVLSSDAYSLELRSRQILASNRFIDMSYIITICGVLSINEQNNFEWFKYFELATLNQTRMAMWYVNDWIDFYSGSDRIIVRTNSHKSIVDITFHWVLNCAFHSFSLLTLSCQKSKYISEARYNVDEFGIRDIESTIIQNFSTVFGNGYIN